MLYMARRIDPQRLAIVIDEWPDVHTKGRTAKVMNRGLFASKNYLYLYLISGVFAVAHVGARVAIFHRLKMETKPRERRW